MKTVEVYLGLMPKNFEMTSLFPPERNAELDGACDKIKKEKVFSWQLLERALKKSFSIDIKSANLKRKPNGKWECDGCFFSITHSRGAVAVALSNEPVGVDMESVERDTSYIEKTLTDSEKNELSSIKSEKDFFLLQKWTEKESLYKRRGVGPFNPFKTETSGEFFVSKRVELGGEVFVLTVSCDAGAKVNLIKELIEK